MGDDRGGGHHLVQQAQTLSRQLAGQYVYASRIAPRPVEAGGRPLWIGSLPMLKTIGTVEVAALAARAEASPPPATMTAT